MRLTDELIRKHIPPASGQTFLWDDLVAGFGVRFTPTRTAFVVQWRELGGRKPRESLRPHFPTLSTARARDLARKRLGEVTALNDTATEQPLRLAMRAWYERKLETADWRPRYRQKVDGLIRAYVEGETRERLRLTPAARKAVETLGEKPVGLVKRADVVQLVDHIKRGSAEQFMAIGSAFYNDMLERGVETTNPFRNRLRVTGGRRVRSRYLNDAEFLKLWRAFQAEGDPNFAAFQMLAYTGARRREVTEMGWAELDLEAATWSLPPERRKTGRRDREVFVVTLHPAALEVIERQPQLEGNLYVFWGRRDKKAFDFQHLLLDRVRQASGISDWRLHDVRRFVRSGMARLGISQAVAEMCLGHVAKAGLVAVYDRHSYAAEKAEAWRRWGDHLHAITTQSPTP